MILKLVSSLHLFYREYCVLPCYLDCLHKKNGSISLFVQMPKSTYVYLTRISCGSVNYDSCQVQL